MDLLSSECGKHLCNVCPNELCAYAICDFRCEECHPRNHCPNCKADCLNCKYHNNCLHHLERIEEGEFDDDDDNDDF